MKINGLC